MITGMKTSSYFHRLALIGNIIDNLIIKTVQNLVNEGYEATFVTKDINSRIKADALGLDAEDYTKGRVISEDFYKGWIRLPIPAKLFA